MNYLHTTSICGDYLQIYTNNFNISPLYWLSSTYITYIGMTHPTPSTSFVAKDLNQWCLTRFIRTCKFSQSKLMQSSAIWCCAATLCRVTKKIVMGTTNPRRFLNNLSLMFFLLLANYSAICGSRSDVWD